MVPAAIIVGALLGAWRARRRQGTRLDMLQWAAVHAILFGLAAVILTILIGRMG